MVKGLAMSAIILLSAEVLVGAPGDVFKTWWRGIYVQSFAAGGGSCIKGLKAVGPDTDGFVYLQAVTTHGDSGYVFKTWWRGIQVQSFLPDPPHCLRGFNTISSGEWVILEAYNGFTSGQVLKTRLRGTFVQEFHGDCPIVGFVAREEPGGWIYLSVDTACGILGDTSALQVEESQKKRFTAKIRTEDPPNLFVFVPDNGVIDIKVYSFEGRVILNRREKITAGFTTIPLKVSGKGVFVAVVKWGREKRFLRFIVRKETGR